MPNSPKEFLAVDIGAARVGVARGTDAARLAQPLAVWPAAEAVGRLKELAEKYDAAGIVVGLPRGLSGQETGQTAAARAWAKRAQAQISRPFYWQDEALTSQTVDSRQSTVHSPGVDATAAAMILQDFLDSTEDDRVPV